MHDEKRNKIRVEDENISYSYEFQDIDKFVDEGDQNDLG